MKTSIILLLAVALVFSQDIVADLDEDIGDY
jgi:hypothetical protein